MYFYLAASTNQKDEYYFKKMTFLLLVLKMIKFKFFPLKKSNVILLLECTITVFVFLFRKLLWISQTLQLELVLEGAFNSAEKGGKISE